MKLFLGIVSASFGFTFVSAAGAADLLSGSVYITNNYPDVSSVYSPSAGVFVEAGGATTGIITLNASQYSFSFTANTITFNNAYGGSWGPTGPSGYFNGFILKFSGVPKISGVTNDPGNQNDPTITYTGDTIFLDYAGQLRTPGSSVFDVTTSSAPEPATWALMLAGFGGLGAMMRSRRNVAVAATA